MMNLIKPNRLRPGDKIATVSSSWGGAGDERLRYRYETGKKRLEEEFGLKVFEMENTLKGSKYLYEHPEKRAEDLMNAFSHSSIKGIFSCIGGDDSIRMLPYIDFEVIRKNPKVFIGYSDTTITHFMCLKAGLSSFYGASILGEFGENVKIYDYTVKWLKKTLFSDEIIGRIPQAEEWTGDRIEWIEENKFKVKTMYKNNGYELLQGKGKVTGHLIGGCMEVMEMMKGSSLWPSQDIFKNSILFFETSEDMPDPTYVKYWLRNYGTLGILNSINGIIWGKPYQEKYYDEYKDMILKVMAEFGLIDLPILYNMSFGHNQPMMCIPMGVSGEIDCENISFKILDAGVK